MAFLNRLKNFFIRSQSGQQPGQSLSPYLQEQFYSYTAGGTAMNIATVYRCVRLLSQSVAALPLRPMVRRGAVFVPDSRSAWGYFLGVQPDLHIGAFDFIAQTVEHMLLRGNAYIVPVRAKDGTPLRLALCAPGTVVHDVLNDTYTVSDAVTGVDGTYHLGEIIHIPYALASNGKTGLSVIGNARRAIGTASAGDAEAQKRFESGGAIRGLLINDTGSSGFGKHEISEMERAASQMAERATDLIVPVPAGTQFTPTAMSSADLQFLQSRQFTVIELCRFFGVHPSYAYENTASNYKSAESANADFLNYSLAPLLKKIENAFDRVLVPPSLYGKMCFRFDRSEAYACDLLTRVNYQTKALAAGVRTPNELRIQDGQQPVEGGDILCISTNLRPVTEMAQESSTPPVNAQ